jgi:hypothetical protein
MARRIDSETLEIAALWAEVNGTAIEDEIEIELQLA